MDATRYMYKALESKLSIRVLILEKGSYEDPIRCRLNHVDFAQKPQYEALSYVWGETSETKEVFCDEIPMQITRSLHGALRHLRHKSTERVLWADAVCINQRDNVEKSHQVALMGEIYSNCSQVLVWIGEDIDGLSGTFRIVQELHEIFLQTEDDYPYEELTFEGALLPGSSTFSNLLRTQDLWKETFLRLIRQPWFLRRWVIQEIAKAPAATVICGFEAMPWSVLADVYWCIYKSGVFSYILDPIESRTGFHTGMVIMGLIRRDSRKKDHAPLLESVVSTRYFKCTDSRDVVYSLLGLGGDVDQYGDSLIPDYSLSVEEVFKRFVIGCFVEKGSLYPLSVPYTPPHYGAMDLPSWVPDFTHLEATNPLIRMRMGNGLPFHAGSDLRPRVRVSEGGNLLFAWGKIVDIVKETAPPLDEVHSVDTERLSAAEIGVHRVKKWLDFRKNLVSYDDIIQDEEGRFEAFWRTMIFNLTASADRAPPEYAEYFKAFMDHFFRSETIVPEAQEPLRSQLLQIETAVNSRAEGWRMFTTENSRLGQGLRSVQRGDTICVLDGGELPYVVRRVEMGHYRFIGSCYLHGLMNGEAYNHDASELTEFGFC
ncbi:heterokaryon incompatibility protein-domain-containing protein [Cadophora sp. MPI-SDFR-AT-0126]|nr:heterokaryon incompatibility protein-domain-containing protein [Leotiomycetes sp. MPI-SDFR-AT-0126]